MNLQSRVRKAAVFLKKRKFFISAIFLFFVVLVALAAVFLKGKPSAPVEKAWEIDLTYNTNTKKLSLDKLKIVNNQVITDKRAALYSPYFLKVLDKNGNAIFSQKINITEQILYDYFINAPNNLLILPSGIKTSLFIPYQNGASKILIFKNNNKVLQINLPQNLSFNIVQSASASTQSISCGPLTTVFINNNYANIDQFKKDVSYLENLYNATAPYNINPSIFNFEEVDAAQNFGCETKGITWCMENLSGQIKAAGLKYYPNAQKFILLVDNPNAMTVDGGIAGLVNGVGGDVIIYTNYVYSGPTGEKPFAAASHELEGHAVGYLWDRYVSTDPGYSAIPSGYPQSNCSTNPQGESFWQGAGSTGAYKGCANSNQYAPYPLTCQSHTSNLISGGTNNTIMSAIGCAPNEFDPVEQAWIKNNILPYYKPCSQNTQATNTPIPTSTPAPSPTPAPTPVPVVHSITGSAFVDSNNNGIQDPGESGYPGLAVSISGPVSESAVTDASGKYTFTNIPAGTYAIQTSDSRLTITFSSSNLSISQNTTVLTVNFPIPAYALSTPTPTPVPDSPQNLKAAVYCDNHGPNTTNVAYTDFTWGAVPGSSLYVLYYQNGVQYGPYYSQGTSFTAPLPVGTTSWGLHITQCTDPKQAGSGYACGFTPGTVTWKVAAMDSSGRTGPYSQTGEFTVPDCSSSPSPTPSPSAYSSATTYTCVLDPSCLSGQSTLQICPLKCTPN